MAGRGRALLWLAALSASLAALVPGVLEPAAASRSRSAPSLVEAPIDDDNAVKAAPPLAGPSRLPRAQEPAGTADRRRTSVPPGCERLVSPLARSTASAALGRCIT